LTKTRVTKKMAPIPRKKTTTERFAPNNGRRGNRS
jgi:hypothetical protein